MTHIPIEIAGINAEDLNARRQEAKEFKEKGGNIALFWAGQMASAAGRIPTASPLELSAHLITLDKMREEYDRCLLSQVQNKE